MGTFEFHVMKNHLTKQARVPYSAILKDLILKCIYLNCNLSYLYSSSRHIPNLLIIFHISKKLQHHPQNDI